MDAIDKALSALLTFMGILFSLIIVWALSESFAHLHIELFGSRVAIFWAMLAAAIAGGLMRWRLLAGSARPANAEPGGASLSASEMSREPVVSAASIGAAPSTPLAAASADEREPGELDMACEEDVAQVRSRREPALWHAATMAALAYRGDPHGFLDWVLQQPETDRATAGWIFLWAEGSRYLRGGTDFPLNNLASDKMLELFRAVCDRSEGMGFTNDDIGLDQDLEAERMKCLTVIESGELAPGLVAPIALLGKAFGRPGRDDRFSLDDGIIIQS